MAGAEREQGVAKKTAGEKNGKINNCVQHGVVAFYSGK
jgi:hypothetical protein